MTRFASRLSDLAARYPFTTALALVWLLALYVTLVGES